MKKVLMIASVAFMAVGFTSCEKCGHCDTSAGEGPEVCGTSSEIDDAEAACELVGGDWHND